MRVVCHGLSRWQAWPNTSFLRLMSSAASTRMRSITPELVDYIIDHLADIDSAEGDAVKAAGLVCRQWLLRSRFHLFSEVLLVPDRAAFFFSVVDTSSLDLLFFVQELLLDFTSDESFEEAHILRLAASCPNLSRLYIENGEYIESEDDIETRFNWLQSEISFIGRHLTSITLLQWQFHHFPLREMMDIIAEFSSLETLELIGDCISLPVYMQLQCALPPHLRALALYVSDGSGHLFNHISSLPSLPTLHSLTLDAESLNQEHAFAAAKAYLQNAGSKLRSFKLFLSEGSREELDFQTSALHSAVNLQSLELHVMEPSHVLEALNKLVSSSLTKIRVNSVGETVLSWGDIDKALASPQFHSLKRFYGSHQNVPMTTVPEVQAQMSLAVARRILF
ncbi:hypothetical protein C8J57DRAFT_492378 [Mycena rebaudengoi]|nr:hypothetical protein C8J57DRAFT_492378 [Mycena rebaudengoi]